MSAEVLQLKTIKLIMQKIIFIFLLLCTFSIAINAQGNEQQTKMKIMMKMMNLKNALLSKDSIALTSLLANDVTYGHTNGLIQTKQQIIRSVMSGDQDYKKIDPINMDIRVFDNTAIVTMSSIVNMNYQNKPLDFKMYVTLVWINDQGEWKLEARQSVKINE